MEATVTSIANVGRIRIRENRSGVNCLIIDNFAPTIDGNKVAGFIPVSIVIATLRSDVKSNVLILSIAKAIQKSGENLSLNDCVENAIRTVLSHLRIKATYVLHKEGEEYEGGKYTTDWYQLDADSIRFSYGEHKDAYNACDVDYFLKESKSVIEDF